MHWTLLDLMWIVIVSYTTILIIYLPIHPEMGLFAEDDISKTRIICQLLQSPFNEHTSMSTVVYLQAKERRKLWYGKIHDLMS